MTQGQAIIPNISNSLTWAEQRYGDREALVFEQRRWTYVQLNADVHALAAGLRDQGVLAGDRIAVIATNSPEFLMLALALARLGAVLVPLNYRLQQPDLIELIERSGAIGLASEAEFSEAAKAILASVPRIRLLLALAEHQPHFHVSIPALIAGFRGSRVEDAICTADCLQRIMYTSGTTSRPKGARITHGNCWANVHAHAVEFGITHRDRVMVVAPFYHVGGFDIPGLTVLHVGGTLVLLRRFTAGEALATIERERITGTTLVATMLIMMLQEPETASVHSATLRWIIFGQVTRALVEQARKLFPTAALSEGYGMTEACGGVAYVPPARMQDKLGSVGLAVQGMDIRVVDDSGQPVPTGTTGEIVLRGPKVFDGYADDPETSSRSLKNGWLHTGDVGRFDADGYLYVSDRIKDMIRSGGENISASEIEQVVMAADDIHETAVIGIPDSHWVEVPAVFVVSRSGTAVDGAALRAHCRRHLAGFKLPKALFQLPALPRNVTGKVLKDQLRTHAREHAAQWRAEADVE